LHPDTKRNALSQFVEAEAIEVSSEPGLRGLDISYEQFEPSRLGHTSEPDADDVFQKSIDPALWVFHISAAARQRVIERGPQQVKEFEFPISRTKRRFLKSNYDKILSNGEVVERKWLIYSVSKDSVFCFCCKLFDKRVGWPKLGYSDWKNLGLVEL